MVKGKKLRPKYSNSFKHRKFLKTHFYTSNIEKILQARIIFGRFGQNLSIYRSKNEPYEEHYHEDTEYLLKTAVKQIVNEFDLNSPFFIEDTSLRIECLSDAQDIPGMRVKEWFANITFDELDQILKANGNNRSVTVKSDIALHLPTLPEPILFNGETIGNVANTSPEFLINVQYPWLTPDTFNGWFIPDGSDKRLGEMEFEESLDYDFRAKSLSKLAIRLNQFSSILNLSPQNLTHRYKTDELVQLNENNLEGKQLSLGIFPNFIENILIIGPKCAGKSTFGDYLQTKDDFCHIEASTVLRELAEKNNFKIESGSDAYEFLEEKGFDAVAIEISNYFLNSKDERRTNIITGFRTVEEILHFFKSNPKTVVIYLDADPRIRFERHIKRARGKDMQTMKQFKENDDFEASFGLLRVGQIVADFVIVNDEDMSSFHEIIDKNIKKFENFTRENVQITSEVVRSLMALNSIDSKATCEEISNKSANFGEGKVRKYNTNRALKEIPEFSKRYEGRKNEKLKYSILYRGKIFLELLKELGKI